MDLHRNHMLSHMSAPTIKLNRHTAAKGLRQGYESVQILPGYGSDLREKKPGSTILVGGCLARLQLTDLTLLENGVYHCVIGNNLGIYLGKLQGGGGGGFKACQLRKKVFFEAIEIHKKNVATMLEGGGVRPQWPSLLVTVRGVFFCPPPPYLIKGGEHRKKVTCVGHPEGGWGRGVRGIKSFHFQIGFFPNSHPDF